jgi:hypothetical protein
MKHSRFISIDTNILLEYIYDDSNLIGEPYNILVNNKTNTRSFVSTDILRPPIRGYVQTNNDPYNQLFQVSPSSYAKLPTLGNNTISDDFPFIQLKNFSTSIPIRYDKIRIHLPVSYTFGDNKGFYLRVYTLDATENKIVELSNYYFDISDIEQNYKLEFSSQTLYLLENQWGKYIEVQIPSVTKVSDQLTSFSSTNQLGVPRANSINFNLTDGVGLSRNSPIFIDFKDIESVTVTNNQRYFNTSTRKTVVIPQTPEFENLGVRIEESTQGDFFQIYATYNGTAPEFVDYLDELLSQGFKYMVKYVVDLFEENVKTKSYTFTVQDDFAEEIEFRPIFKYTTTTAIIDVTLRLININDNSVIERKASYGLLQGGGQMMGSQINGKITTGNKSGGGGDISKYSASLSKINLKTAKKPEVINYKEVTVPKVGMENFGTRPLLILEKLPFVIYSSSFDIIDDALSHQIE